MKDIYPGASGSNPSNLTNVNGTLFFQANDGTNGAELWKSDGTAAGTVLVKGISPGANGSVPYHLTNVNGTLFFAANDGTNGIELWKSDGTAAGTVLVKDIYLGISSSAPERLALVGPRLFFSADDGASGPELWALGFPDLSVTKTDGVTAVAAGGSVTYTVVVSNAGVAVANGAPVSDAFPAVLSCSTTCVGAGGATCTAGPFAGNINDTVTLPVGGTATYTSACTVSPSATGTITNTATVTAPPMVTDPDTSNNSATDVDTVVPGADLSVALSDSPDPVAGLGTVTYTVEVSNAGSIAATSVQVVQSITSAPVTGVTFQSASGTGWSCSAGSFSVTCTRASLASGTAAPALAIQWSVGPAGGTLLAQAVVSASEPDPQAGNNTANASTTVTGVPYTDLSISKNDGGATALWNRPIVYTLTVNNAGPGVANGATVVDSFPAPVASVTWTCSASAGSSCPASGSGNINTTVNLLVGGTVAFTAAGTVLYGTVGPIANTATVASPIFDTNAANNTSTVNTPVNTDLIFKDGFQ